MALRLVKTAVTLLAIALPLLPMSTAFGQEAHGNQAFGFRAPSVTGHIVGGVVTGEVSLAGGGAYDTTTGFIHAGGSFKCIETVTNPGATLNGCLAGQGGRWHALTLLPQRQFRCTGQPLVEGQKIAKTDDNTVVMVAHFFLQGEDEPRAAVEMFVSQVDEAPAGLPGTPSGTLPGNQKAWIQGVGCGDAIANFN